MKTIMMIIGFVLAISTTYGQNDSIEKTEVENLSDDIKKIETEMCLLTHKKDSLIYKKNCIVAEETKKNLKKNEVLVVEYRDCINQATTVYYHQDLPYVTIIFLSLGDKEKRRMQYRTGDKIEREIGEYYFKVMGPNGKKLESMGQIYLNNFGKKQSIKHLGLY